MKTTINKETILISETKAAKELQAEFASYNNDMLDTLLRAALRANASRIGQSGCDSVKLISFNKAEITKNKYRFTAWIECYAKLGMDIVVLISFDGVQALQYSDGQTIDAYIEVYRNKD